MQNAADVLCGLNKESRTVFSLIQKKGPLTKSELLLITKMKLTSLNRFMQPLEDKKLIVQVGIGESTGGRKPVVYDVNPLQYYVIGIDISRTYTQIVISNLKMEILNQQQFTMTQSFTPEKTAKAISHIIKNMLGQLSIDRSMILGAGVGTIGPLDRKKGIILNPKNFAAPGWVNVPIKQILEQELQLPVVIDNGANTAVLAESLFGCGKDFENIAYFNCGIGIRTGAISGGTIVRTINDAEDAFGHMVIDVDGELCSCGNYGCVEAYSSILSITNKFMSAIKKGRTSIISKPLETIGYIDICNAAEKKDELARETIINAATILGTGLANYINLLSPDLVILSGPLVKHSELFYEVCTQVAIKKYYLKQENKMVFSKGGDFKDNAIAVGAAAAVVEQILNNTL
ncbi:MAG: hypothetical protein PWR27_1183 [Petroclostridium sp.]|jgi:predicted NBD/HSP70 family sugar kinase|nr:hypothetical protein [Petroclostridium sp.]